MLYVSDHVKLYWLHILDCLANLSKLEIDLSIITPNFSCACYLNDCCAGRYNTKQSSQLHGQL